MSALWTRYRRVLGSVAPNVLAAAIALAVVGLLWLTSAGWLAGVGLIALAGMEWWRLGTIDSRPHRVARAVTVTALAAAAWRAEPQQWWFALTLLALLGALLIEPTTDRMTAQDVAAWRLPGPTTSFVTGALQRAILLVTAALALVVLGVPVVWFAVLTVLALGATAFATLQQVRAARRHQSRRVVAKAMVEYGPRFAILFSGKAESAYQITMWLPYLERTGQRYVLLVRERAFVPTALGLTSAPVVCVESVESLECLLVDSIGAVFYVNNAIKNADGIRFVGPTHVHLGHGDSEKPASYHKATAMYDEIFVAGQAGIDRFARNDVVVPREKFRIVGRPQVESIERVRAERPQQQVVLYAPTWQGSLADMDFGSLTMGRQIVEELIGLGVTVIFRPHPYSSRDARSRVLIEQIDAVIVAAGPAHLPSHEAAKLSIIDCFNRSDAMVTDVSSVASDYLYSGKPLAITDTGVVSGALSEALPVAAAAIVVRPAPELSQALRRFVTVDPLVGQRQQLRAYYLGDVTHDDYPATFVRAVHEAIERGTGDGQQRPLG